MKREEILAFCASNPEVLAYVLSLESQIKEPTGRLQALEARLNFVDPEELEREKGGYKP